MATKLKKLLIWVLMAVLFSGCVKQISQDQPRQRSPRENASFQLMEEGRQHLEADKPDHAIRLLEQAISLNPDNGRCYYYLAEAWIQKGDLSQAEQFNSLAQNHLNQSTDWKNRVKKQAGKIKRLEKR
jgi:cytochrome c-type biogenesis protein CcmH/NrfG